MLILQQACRWEGWCQSINNWVDVYITNELMFILQMLMFILQMLMWIVNKFLYILHDKEAYINHHRLIRY